MYENVELYLKAFDKFLNNKQLKFTNSTDSSVKATTQGIYYVGSFDRFDNKGEIVKDYINF